MPWMVKKNLETKTANLDLDQNCLNFQNLYKYTNFIYYITPVFRA